MGTEVMIWYNLRADFVLRSQLVWKIRSSQQCTSLYRRPTCGKN